MSKRASRRAKKGLKDQQDAYDRSKLERKMETRRPGSLNPRKSGRGTGRRRS